MGIKHKTKRTEKVNDIEVSTESTITWDTMDEYFEYMDVNGMLEEAFGEASETEKDEGKLH